MATLYLWRRAYGAVKDHTKVGLAHVNSNFKDLDVAIVKATNHVERPPKDRHIRKIIEATTSVSPRADVAYCIHALSRRLAKTRNWTVALKTLIVFHRLLREGDPTFKQELLNFQQRRHVLHVSNFKDDSSPIAWDCSAWLRTYALYLEEQLECFRVVKYDIEAEPIRAPAQTQDKGYSRARDSDELLEQLPALQQLLHRLMGCRPEGAAMCNSVIQYALALVLKESFKIYLAINTRIINLVDKFFDMTRHEAIQSLDIYKKAGQQAVSLSNFYDTCKGAELGRNFQFPVLREPPQSFVLTMEEHIREAPRMVSVATMVVDYPERLMLTYKQQDNFPLSSNEITAPLEDPEPPQPHVVGDDLLVLNLITEDTVSSGPDIKETNALALAVVTSGTTQLDPGPSRAEDFDPRGWELALVSTPSSNLSSVQDRQLGGGLDSLTLNSLYEERQSKASQQSVYGAPAPNPFAAYDTLTLASYYPTLPAAMAPQPLVNPFYSFQHAYLLPHHHFLAAPQNPFSDAGFEQYHVEPATQAQTSNPFGGGGSNSSIV